MTPACPYCKIKKTSSGKRPSIVLHGSFHRRSDRALVRRFRCRNCLRSFSSATGSVCCWQKKRHYNQPIFEWLVSGVSQRRAAKVLKLNRKTIVRKFILLGRYAENILPELNRYLKPVQEMEFDDMETMEHSKLKPLSVTLAIESKTRRILGFRVSRMNAKGLLARQAREKYGKRQDERKKNRYELFKELKLFITPDATIKTDMNPHYLNDVKRYFPKAKYKIFKGRRGCVVGQGELKSGGFDPIFSLNHTCAMLRANINRLFRRTWNTTKLPERLSYHIAMYSCYHNLVLIR